MGARRTALRHRHHLVPLRRRHLCRLPLHCRSSARLWHRRRRIHEAAVYDPAGTFANACHAVIVEVDPETGGVRIERYLAVEDAGRLVNPMIVEGQVQGGVAQGIGNALFEEVVYADDGNILTSTFAHFLPPTPTDAPLTHLTHWVPHT